MTNQLICGDCLEVMQEMAADSVSMCLTSPPYTDARTYGIDFALKGQQWVDWMLPRVVEMCRVTNGLVFINMAGKVRNYSYQPVVEWLVTDLTRHHGIVCGAAPYAYYRYGIPGSGGRHYHRRDWEPVYAFARPECLPPPFSDNKATGHPPRWAPGGEMSHRLADGARVNQWGHSIDSGTTVIQDGGKVRSRGKRPFHTLADRDAYGFTPHDEPSESERRAGKRRKKRVVDAPDGDNNQNICAIANSGNVIHESYSSADVADIVAETNDVLKLIVGGGTMGDRLCHGNEAPFPETLATFFILSYACPDGIVCDPFVGSGTTCAVAKRLRRGWIGIDIRESQIEIASKRMQRVQPELF